MFNHLDYVPLDSQCVSDNTTYEHVLSYLFYGVIKQCKYYG